MGLPPVLRQAGKTQEAANGEWVYGIVSQAAPKEFKLAAIWR